MSAFAGESSAALVCDGRLAAAAREERCGSGVPWRAARLCLDRAGVAGSNLDAVVLAHKPLLAAGRIARAGLAYAPVSWERFAFDAGARACDMALGARLRARFGFRGPLLFVERAEALAAAAFAASSFERAAVVLAGTGGEWADSALACADEEGVRVAAVLDYPHSVGHLCQGIREALGVSWERLAELAETGRPRLAPAFARELLDLKDDGSLRLDMGYFSFCSSRRSCSPRLAARVAAEPPADVAASTLALAVDALSRMGAEARRLARAEDVCVAGALARWPAAVETLRRQTPGRVFVDGGANAAAGAAALAWSRGLKRGRVALAQDLPAAAPASETSALPWPAAAATLAWRAALAVTYFGILAPFGLLLRLFGVQFLDERFSGRSSYWTARRDAGDVLELRRRS